MRDSGTEIPALSVILVSAGGLATLQLPLPGLKAQTIADRIELILVAQRGKISPAEIAGLDGFHSVKLREVDHEVRNRGREFGAALALATAPYVVPHENHTRAAPDAFEKLLAGFGNRTAAVGPMIRAANAENSPSLAMYALTYGFCSPPGTPGPHQMLPHFNAAFSRATLDALDGSPEARFADESGVHTELIEKGYELRHAPEADIWHINEGRIGRLFGDSFWIGREFGYGRSRGWSWSRRIVYVLLLPVISALTWARLCSVLRRATDADGRRLVAMLWSIPTALAFSTGEVSGYLATQTPENPEFERHELHVHGRLAGRTPDRPWLADAVRALPAGTP